MTGLEMTQPRSEGGGFSSTTSLRRDLPAAVDEQIRSELASIQRDIDDDLSSTSDESFSESGDEFIDEDEMERLTRERGFGLGRWIDRLVEWTLFGVDENLPTAASAVQFDTSDASPRHSRNVSIAEDDDDDVSLDYADDNASTLTRDYDKPAAMEKPGNRGGWEDAEWLFRAMKRALL